MSTEGLFNTTVKGRYPLSDHISAAPAWLPTEGAGAYVPRPDKTLTGLRIASFLGLDHFYLRSPITGLFKLILTGLMIGIGASASGASKIGALLVGIWYMWDLGQVFFEGDRVVKYGMTTPFDMQTGIGQGMITDGATHYAQRKNFGVASFRTLFGFLGIDALMSKPALFIRKLVDFAAFAGFMHGIISSGAWTAPTAGNVVGLVFLMIFAAIFGTFVWIPWWASVSSTVFNPKRMFAQGIKVDPDTMSFLNYFNGWTEDIGTKTRIRVTREFGYGNVEPEDLKADFGIEYRNDEVKKAEKKASAKEGDEPADPSTWLVSLFLGNILTGRIGTWVLAFFPTVKMGIEAAMTAAECIRSAHLAEGSAISCVPKNPLGALGAFVPPGVTAGLAEVTTAASAASALGGAGEAVAELASTIPLASLSPPPLRLPTPSLAAGGAAAGLAARLASTGGGAAEGPSASSAASSAAIHRGGARHDASTISTEGKILGAVTVALVAGGALKGAIDYLVKE
jgi:TM2 domain-containing membrane protein YozV